MGYLEFDDSNHEYFLEGQPIPSVTTVLKDVGIYKFWEGPNSEWYMERGTKVHKAVHFLEKGTLDRKSLDERIEPYVKAWEKFKEEHIVVVHDSEIRLYDSALWVAGTADILCDLFWEKSNIDAVVDIKCGGHQTFYAYQLAGYELLSRDQNTRDRFSLHLKDDETYELKKHKEVVDYDIFIGAVNTYHAKKGRRWLKKIGRM